MPLPLLPLIAPMLIAGGMAAGGQALNALPTLMRTKTDKYNAEKLKRLEALDARNALGLSQKKKEAIRSAIIDPSLKSVTDYQSLIPVEQGVAAGDLQARRAAAGAQLGDTARIARTTADAEVRQADAAMRQSKRQELEDRMNYQSQRRTQQLAAALSIPQSGLSAATKSYDMNLDTGMGAPNELTENTTSAQRLVQMYKDDPEMLELISSYGGQ